MFVLPDVAVIIVGFCNPDDIVGCLRALGRTAAQPRFDVFIAENGGSEATDTLVAALTEGSGPCLNMPEPEPRVESTGARRLHSFKLVGRDFGSETTVRVAEMPENLGYAGGVNAWLEPLLKIPGWRAAWILNPDTEPDYDALRELVAYAARHGREMVGSRLSPRWRPELIHARGLAWRKWRASTCSVGFRTPSAVRLPPEADRELDSPSGASIYVTRRCITRIGLMNERYFLYFEDLDWGIKAKRHGVIGYAHESIVHHSGGTTIGTATSRAGRSQLAVYLEFRNRLLFVSSQFPYWLPWTVLMGGVDLVLYAWPGSFGNLVAALRGMGAGLMGRTGRPDHILRSHLTKAGAAPR